MKKFLIKVTFLFVILIIPLMIYNYLYINTEYYANLNGMDKFSCVPEHIDIANFGSSHGEAAYQWEEYSEFSGMNMALASQTLVYDKAILEQYFNRMDRSTIVIIDVTFRSLYEKENEIETNDPKITRYYKILDKKNFNEYNFENAVAYKYIPVIGAKEDAPHVIYNDLIGIKDEDPHLDLPWRGWEYSAILELGQQRAMEFMDSSDGQELREQWEACIDMIELCQKNGMQVILVTSPTMSCFYENFDDDFMKKFYLDMESLASEYQIEYLDYTGDKRFPDDSLLFSDPDHMSVEGGRLFTKILLEDNKELFQNLYE